MFERVQFTKRFVNGFMDVMRNPRVKVVSANEIYTLFIEGVPAPASSNTHFSVSVHVRLLLETRTVVVFRSPVSADTVSKDSEITFSSVNDAVKPMTSPGESKRTVCIEGLLMFVLEMNSEKLLISVAVLTYTTLPSGAEMTLLATVIPTSVSDDVPMALKMPPAAVTFVKAKLRPLIVEPAEMFTKLLLGDVDDDIKIVTFEQEPSTRALCSVLDCSMNRLAPINVPDWVIFAIVDDLITTDAPVPDSVRVSEVQPTKTYDEWLDVVIVAHAHSTPTSTHP